MSAVPLDSCSVNATVLAFTSSCTWEVKPPAHRIPGKPMRRQCKKLCALFADHFAPLAHNGLRSINQGLLIWRGRLRVFLSVAQTETESHTNSQGLKVLRKRRWNERSWAGSLLLTLSHEQFDFKIRPWGTGRGRIIETSSTYARVSAAIAVSELV